MAKINARVACRLLIAMCLGCLAAVAFPQQEAPAPVNSAGLMSTLVSSPTESQASQDQNRVQVQNADAAKSGTETKTQPQAEPTKKRSSADAEKPNPRHRAAPKHAGAPVSPGTPKKIVVREGGAEEPMAQIVTGMSPEEADRQRREAELLLSTTSETLKEIAPRPLDAQQQETVSQIHNYMEGSRSALKEGDVARAHTLALKAGLLADDLVRH